MMPTRSRSRTPVRVALLHSLPALLVLATTPVLADMPGDVPDTLRFSLGGMAADTFTEAGLGSADEGVGAFVNFEDALGLPDNKSVSHFDAAWRFGKKKRQYLDFGYVALNRSATRTISEDVEWGDFTFLTGADVHTVFNSSFAYVAWRYDFLQLEQVRISGSAGFDYLGIETSLEATGNVRDEMGVIHTETINEGFDAAYPVPQFGLQLDWALTRRLSMRFFNRLIVVNVADIDGKISESTIRLNWYFTKHVGIAGGIDKESIDLKEFKSGNTTARFRYEVHGLAFYLNLAF